MKKTYIIPEMQLMVVDCEKLIAESLVVSGSGTAQGDDGGWVKENNSSTPSYNVWDDDWNK